MSDKKELISIIIPVYNGEKYLEECLDSVIKQTYKELEIIVVNDGSTDKTGSIIDSYVKKDIRIKQIALEKQKGVALARNAGIENAEGDYISFIDSDDVISNDFIENLFSEMDDETDVVCSGYYDFKDSINNIMKTLILPNKSNKTVDETYGVYSDLFLESVAMQAVWGKIFRKELFKNLYFESLEIGEDEVLLVQIMISNAVFKTCEYAGYYYRKHNDSVLGRANMGKEFVKNDLKAKLLIVKRMESVSEYCRKQSANNFKKRIMYIIFRLKRWEDNKESFLACSGVIRNYKKILLRMSKLSFKEKMIIFTYSYFPRLLWLFI